MRPNPADTTLYRSLRRIRSAEAAIVRHYPENEMKTPMHMSMGQEAIATAVCHALKPEDQVFSSYRTHGIYLARTGDLAGFFAELYGKVTGPARGKAGSMHMAAPEFGFQMSSAIVGSQIPVAVGAAFASKYAHKQSVVAVFFGDGAVEEGAFWESLNLAAIQRLPVLFVCEDNGIAVHTAAKSRQGFRRLPEIAEKFDISVRADLPDDVHRLHGEASALIEDIRETKRPGFLHVPCYRWLEHVGVNFDFEANYRPKAEFEDWQANDSLLTERKRLLHAGAEPAALDRLDAEIEREVQAALAGARSAEFPAPTELYDHVTS